MLDLQRSMVCRVRSMACQHLCPLAGTASPLYCTRGWALQSQHLNLLGAKPPSMCAALMLLAEVWTLSNPELSLAKERIRLPEVLVIKPGHCQMFIPHQA